MSNFYTNVMVNGDQVFVRGIENGKKIQRKVDFFPTLYTTSNKKDTQWKTIYGESVEEIKPGTIKDTREFIKKYQEIENFKLYGNTDFSKQFISDEYPGIIKYDKNLLTIKSIDIETTTEHGLSIDAVIKNPVEEITLISIMDSNTKVITTFGKPWNTPDKDGPYILCQSETHLLREFMSYWTMNYPDIITGWNTNSYDFPYLIRRIERVIGDGFSNKLSPWGKIREKVFKDKNGNEKLEYTISGVAMLDYLELFKKFGFIQTENNKLDTVAEVVLGENKKVNPGTSFKDFYTNCWDHFISYNRQDSRLVDMLDDKLKLIDLAMTLAYYSKINIDEVYGPVGMWDCIIYNYLRDKNIVIPQKKNSQSSQGYEGAYVQDPVIGYHKWIASFDLASLYPHLIMNYNISPETITDIKIPCSVDSLLNQSIDTSFVKDKNVSLTASGWCFRKDKHGFLPELMETLYADRSKYKKEMLSYEQQYENDKSNKSLLNEIARLNSLQMALKIALNSLYGALGNQFFRYYDLRMAESITLSGQLANRWNANMMDTYFNKILNTTDIKYTVAGDTDSNYLSLETLVERSCVDKTTEQKIKFMDKICSTVIQPMIDSSYQKLADYMNAYSQKMIMKREVLADSGVFVAKKKYFLRVHNSEGVQYTEPKLKVTGLELVRTSTPQACRKVLKDTIPVILNGDVDGLKKYVSDFKDKFMKLPVEDIAKPSGVNGMITYKGKDSIYSKGTPIHVRGSLLYNFHLNRLGLSKEYESIQDEDKIKFVYVKKPNPFQEDVIAFPGILPSEFGLDNYINRELQFEKVFMDALQIMVNPLGWNLDDSANLEDFFG